MSRRLPVFLVVDTSESMAGAPLQAVQDGVATLLNAMRSDPRCMETVYLSLITFGATARQAVTLTPVDDFRMPKLKLGTGTPFGAALDLLSNAIDTQVQRGGKVEIKGDWRPLCFILTDGMPTDDWRTRARALRAKVDSGSCSIVAFACGADVDLAALGEVTPSVLQGGVDAASLSAFFRWVTASVRAASVAVGDTGVERFPSPPKEIGEATLRERGAPARPNLFLVARCQKNRLPYVMKHRWDGSLYRTFESVPLDDIEIGAKTGMTAQSDSIGSSPCPHCSNAMWAYCSCERPFCCPSGSGRFTCPWCERTDDYSPSSFSITGSGG